MNVSPLQLDIKSHVSTITDLWRSSLQLKSSWMQFRKTCVRPKRQRPNRRNSQSSSPTNTRNNVAISKLLGTTRLSTMDRIDICREDLCQHRWRDHCRSTANFNGYLSFLTEFDGNRRTKAAIENSTNCTVAATCHCATMETATAALVSTMEVVEEARARSFWWSHRQREADGTSR